MTAPQWDRPADRLRQQAETAYQRIRSRSELTDAAKRALIAKQYVTHKSQMETLAQRSAQDRDIAKTTARRQVFGVEDLRGRGSGAGFGAFDLAWRSVQEKAAELPANHITWEMKKANDNGDEMYLRALGNRLVGEFLDMRQAGFPYSNPDLDNYLAARPAQADALNKVLEMSNGTGAVADMFEFAIPTPGEISNSTYNVEALAAQADALQEAMSS